MHSNLLSIFYVNGAGAALGFENHGAKVTYIVSKLGSCLAHEVKISKIHGAIAPPAPP